MYFVRPPVADQSEVAVVNSRELAREGQRCKRSIAGGTYLAIALVKHSGILTISKERHSNNQYDNVSPSATINFLYR